MNPAGRLSRLFCSSSLSKMSGIPKPTSASSLLFPKYSNTRGAFLTTKGAGSFSEEMPLRWFSSLSISRFSTFRPMTVISMVSKNCITLSESPLMTAAGNFRAINLSHTRAVDILGGSLVGQHQPNRGFSAVALDTIDANQVPKAVKIWIVICAAMVLIMIVIGGITRLTESGLSIVEWAPVRGILAPTNEQEWEVEFEKYKDSPEYKIMNKGMQIEEFKKIYFWEYFHRLWGRMIGLAFALPFAFFAWRKMLIKPLMNRCTLLLSGIGANGLLGWYMVKSGLQEKEEKDKSVVRVSQYRLASHFITAVTLYSGMTWTALQLWLPNKQMAPYSMSAPGIALLQQHLPVLKVQSRNLLGLVFVTALSGAFVAGLDAGLIYNEFPLMGGKVVPHNAWNSSLIDWKATFSLDDDQKPPTSGVNLMRGEKAPFGTWLRYNLFENDEAVQFNHRVLAISTASAIGTFFWASRRFFPLMPKQARMARTSMLHMMGLQVGMGIATLLTFVPVSLAAAHQAGSVTLLSIGLWMAQEIRRIRL